MYNFKKLTKVYLVRSGVCYELPVYPDISFSQTFNEIAIPVKTLHSPENFFDSAVITDANPANFSFSMPVLKTSHYRVIYDLLVDVEYRGGIPSLLEFDLYFQTDSELFKLEKAVLDSGIFQFDAQSIIIVSLSGTGSRLTNITGESIPGTVANKPLNFEYGTIRAFEAQVNSTIIDRVKAATIELRNNIIWLPVDNIHYDTTGFSSTKYPSINILQGKTLSGTLEQFMHTAAAKNDWKIGDPISIKAGESSSAYLLEVDIPHTVCTARINPADELIVRGLDFRAITNYTSLRDIVKLNQS